MELIKFLPVNGRGFSTEHMATAKKPGGCIKTNNVAGIVRSILKSCADFRCGVIAHAITGNDHQIVNICFGDCVRQRCLRGDCKATGTCDRRPINCADLPVYGRTIGQAVGGAKRFERTGQHHVGKSVKQDENKSMKLIWHKMQNK